LANLRRYRIRLYITFVFGYDADTRLLSKPALSTLKLTVFYIAAFNHLTPFPGTPLYRRLQQEGRLLYPAWWLDDAYSYNQTPFQPRHLSPQSYNTIAWQPGESSIAGQVSSGAASIRSTGPVGSCSVTFL